MQVTIINDCCDENAKLRQISRACSLIKNSSASCFGVKSEMEAAGFLVDAVDAFDGRSGVVLANVAPRGGKGRKWENGTPFGLFQHEKTFVVSSVDGFVLSLAKKLGILKKLYVFDIVEVLKTIKDPFLDDETKERIVKSQFRSFDFVPRLAAWLVEGKKMPAQGYDLSEIPDAPQMVWFIDNFGNIKTTLLKEELDIKDGNKVKLKVGNKVRSLNFYNRLKDIPDKTIGLVVGSSGIGEKRFVEIMFRGGNAAKTLGVELNDIISL